MPTIIIYSDVRRSGQVLISGRDGCRDRGIFLWTAVLAGFMAWVLTGGTSLAGTIRDDRDDSLYTSLAAEPQYDCAGMVYTGSFLGSGTLIASEYVLTAGHMMRDGLRFTLDGITFYDADGSNYWQHPTEDIGIFRLSMPVVGVTPAMLYEPSLGSELGLDGTMVGFGYTGTGLTGEIVGTAGVKRAGQNTIDRDGSYWGWSSNLLLIDFDNPHNSRDSKFGSSTPLDLEMGPAHGDSGCGLFVELEGQTYLAGVQSAMWYYDDDDANYGDGGIFVSVGNTIDWINSIMPLPGDANYDGVVDAADAAYLSANWLSTDASWSDCDFNSDGIVDDIDATILAANWQSAASQPPAAVPEPHYAALLLGLLIAGLLNGRRRHPLKGLLA